MELRTLLCYNIVQWGISPENQKGKHPSKLMASHPMPTDKSPSRALKVPLDAFFERRLA